MNLVPQGLIALISGVLVDDPSVNVGYFCMRSIADSRPVMEGCLWLPLPEYNEKTLMRLFTVKQWGLFDGDSVDVPAYILGEGWIGVPRQAGLKLISTNDFQDNTSKGSKVKYPKRPVLHDYQEPFVKDILDKCQYPFSDFRAEAATGKGKTVCSLYAMAELGVTAAAAVDQERLMRQWVESAQTHFGLDAKLTVEEILKGRGKDIGIVQGPVANWRGRKLVICMIQSLTQKHYPDEFWKYFGVLCVDECHVAGAPTFSDTLLNFEAAIRFGVSATNKRSDSLDKLLHWNLGGVDVELAHKHIPSRVYYIESDACVSWYANTAKPAGRYLQELSRNPSRNLVIANAAKYLWGTGRDVLLVSDRVEQLENLRALCIAIGIPSEELGIYARSRVEWRYTKNPTPARNPRYWERGTKFTPVTLTPVHVRNKNKELEGILASRTVILATYKIFEKGVDVPRLSAGIDCTPSRKAVQVHGRILRTQVAKKIPIWATIRDMFSFRAEVQFLSRLTDYAKSNAEVYLWKPQKGIQKQELSELRMEIEQNVAWLRPQKIITKYDGTYTLTTAPTLIVNANPLVTPTVRRTRSRRVS